MRRRKDTDDTVNAAVVGQKIAFQKGNVICVWKKLFAFESLTLPSSLVIKDPCILNKIYFSVRSKDGFEECEDKLL